MSKKITAFFLSVLITFGSISVVSASANGGILVFGGSQNDTFRSIVETADGNWVAVGESMSANDDMQGLSKGGFDAIAVKYDTGGNILWKQSFGGSNSDYFYSAISAPDGSLVAVGSSSSADGDMQGINRGNFDAIIVKYNSDGSVLWKKSFGGSHIDYFHSITLAPDGNLVAAGYSYSTDGDMQGLNKGGSDAIVVKYDPNGNVLWKKSFGGSYGEIFRSVTSTPDGNLVAVGNSNSADGDMQGLYKGNDDAIIVKYDVNGNVLWKKSFGGSNGSENFYSVTPTPDGNLVVAGTSNSSNGDMNGLNKGLIDAIIVKYDQGGNVLWKRSFGGSDADYFRSVTSTPEGNLVAVGYSGSTNDDMQGLNKGGFEGDFDAIIVKYDANGGVLWKKSFGGSNDDYYNSVASIPDGNMVAVGYSNSINGDMQGLNKGGFDTIIVKYDPNGNIVPFADPAPEPASFYASTAHITNQDVIVTINYPEQAVVRQYKIDDGNWMDYTGPVVMTQNGTIYARSQSAGGTWSGESFYVVNNIDKIPPAKPTITADVTSPTSGPVTLTILYSADSEIKEYKLGANGDWEPYTVPVVVTSNTEVYARAFDAAGNVSEIVKYEVTNIVTGDPEGGGRNGRGGVPSLECQGTVCRVLPGINKVYKGVFISAYKMEDVDIEVLVPKATREIANRWN